MFFIREVRRKLFFEVRRKSVKKSKGFESLLPTLGTNVPNGQAKQSTLLDPQRSLTLPPPCPITTAQNKRIAQDVIVLKESAKRAKLMEVLERCAMPAIVFINSKKCVCGCACGGG
jgi:hypothetical protein